MFRPIRLLLRFLKNNRNFTVLLILFGACMVLGYSTGFWLTFRLAYLLLLAMPVAYLWGWSNVRSLDAAVERDADRVPWGQTLEERFRIQNTGVIPKLWLEVSDPSDLPGYHARRVVTLGGHRKRSWDTNVECRQRGSYTMGPLTVISGDPFGIFKIHPKVRERT